MPRKEISPAPVTNRALKHIPKRLMHPLITGKMTVAELEEAAAKNPTARLLTMVARELSPKALKILMDIIENGQDDRDRVQGIRILLETARVAEAPLEIDPQTAIEKHRGSGVTIMINQQGGGNREVVVKKGDQLVSIGEPEEPTFEGEFPSERLSVVALRKGDYSDG